MTQERYARQISLPEIGETGQERLRRGAVMVVGAGGLGSPALLYLAAAGVGRIGVIDADRVDITNLQRQIIHQTAGVGTPKAESARRAMLELNPEISVEAYCEWLTEDNARERLGGWDFVIDAVDNAATKFLIDRICEETGTPYCHGGIMRYGGNIMTVIPGSARLTDLFTMPSGEQKVAAIGPFGAVAGVIGTMQAFEAVKYLTGAGKLMTDMLTQYDALTGEFRRVRVTRNGCC